MENDLSWARVHYDEGACPFSSYFTFQKVQAGIQSMDHLYRYFIASYLDGLVLIAKSMRLDIYKQHTEMLLKVDLVCVR